ncbi:MAG: lysylphosphatidylglycerol synthase domain-containing protein [Polyangiales bacterium]
MLVTLCALGFAGVFVLLLRELGGDELLASLRTLDSLWPALLLLEAARMGCEVVATRAVYGAEGARVPPLRLLRGQLFAQLLDVLMPAGRASAETAKALLYAREVGAPQAAAAATALQLAVLSANAVWVLIGYPLSGHVGLPEPLRLGLIGYVAVTSSLVLAVALLAVAPRVRRLFGRLPLVAASLERIDHLLTTGKRGVGSAVLAQVVSRVLQTAQLALIMGVLGARPDIVQAYFTEAVYLVGVALGELMPAQLGSIDAVFVVAAPSLGLTSVSAFTATLALHAVQVLVAVASGLAALGLWWLETRQTRRRSAAAPSLAEAGE